MNILTYPFLSRASWHITLTMYVEVQMKKRLLRLRLHYSEMY